MILFNLMRVSWREPSNKNQP